MSKKLFLIFILFFCSAFSRSTTFDERINCEESNGIWREFGNGCADECEAKLEEFTICTTVTVYGCECGKSRCWNDEKKSCVALNDYKKIFNAKKEKEKEIAAAARKKREEESQENQQGMLNNFINNVTPTSSIPTSTAEQPKTKTPQSQSAQPPSPIVSTPAPIPPLFLTIEKDRQETEKKKQEQTNSTESISGLPIIPLPK